MDPITHLVATMHGTHVTGHTSEQAAEEAAKRLNEEAEQEGNTERWQVVIVP